jgi:dihydrofolate synthase / folylpolyglutamate synthase
VSAVPVPREGAPLDEWLTFIGAQHPTEIALGLDRVRAVADRLALGAPPVTITVGGTNGKGSTCAFLERILLVAGYRVGLYTSPHLLDYNERVRVDGLEASDEDLAAAFARVEAARGDTPLTYFEFGTLAALLVFAQHKVEATVLEVGLGGRLDAVNIVDADCAIVTSVDLDHQSWLGDTREAIGFEKAGIFRVRRPAIFGDVNPPESLVAHSLAIGADLQVFGRDYRIEVAERQWSFHGRRASRHALPMPALQGAWQLRNAASALAALDELSQALPISLGEVKQGLTSVRLSGRLQVLPGRPATVLDVAHNPHAARALSDGLLDMGYFENTFAVFAMLDDKDIGGVIDAMNGRVDRWFVTSVVSPRAAATTRVMQLLAARGLESRSRAFANVAQALDAARREAGANDRIVVFGSFLTVADALRTLH